MGDVAMYCLTHYINVFQFICLQLLFLLWVFRQDNYCISSIREFPVVRQSFEHDVDASASRFGEKLAQVEPTWLVYRMCARTMGVVKCIVKKHVSVEMQCLSRPIPRISL